MKTEQYPNIEKVKYDYGSRSILQYTLDGEFVKEWESAMAVERELGHKNGNVNKVCHGKKKTAYGFQWRFKNQ